LHWFSQLKKGSSAPGRKSEQKRELAGAPPGTFIILFSENLLPELKSGPDVHRSGPIK
jgi:hypothetical protein